MLENHTHTHTIANLTPSKSVGSLLLHHTTRTPIVSHPFAHAIRCMWLNMVWWRIENYGSRLHGQHPPTGTSSTWALRGHAHLLRHYYTLPSSSATLICYYRDGYGFSMINRLELIAKTKKQQNLYPTVHDDGGKPG